MACALAVAFASSAHAEAVQLACKVESKEIAYYGRTGSMKAGKPTHHVYTVEYLIDFAAPTITVESRLGHSVRTHNPDFGSSVLVDAKGIDSTTTSNMPGGFEMRDYLHFDTDGLRGVSRSDLFSRGALVRHSEGALVCSRRP
jgi:hypothetical protein